MKIVEPSLDENLADAERQHREGYERQPVEPGEFSDWEDEQVWSD
jgi:hypothetical protein